MAPYEKVPSKTEVSDKFPSYLAVELLVKNDMHEKYYSVMSLKFKKGKRLCNIRIDTDKAGK